MFLLQPKRELGKYGKFNEMVAKTIVENPKSAALALGESWTQHYPHLMRAVEDLLQEKNKNLSINSKKKVPVRCHILLRTHVKRKSSESNTDFIVGKRFKSERFYELVYPRLSQIDFARKRKIPKPIESYPIIVPKGSKKKKSKIGKKPLQKNVGLWDYIKQLRGGKAKDFEIENVHRNDHNFNIDVEIEKDISREKREKAKTINDLRRKEKGDVIPIAICEYCNAKFTRVKDLDEHLIEHLRCPKCGIVLKRGRLERHLRTRHNVTYRCSNCSKIFRSKQNLVKHVETIHQGIRKFHCDQCNKSFSQLFHLKLHIQIHTIKNFSCHLCPMRFTSKQYLKIHIRKHIGLRPWKCEKCEKSFCSPYVLASHNLSHYPSKFKCSECSAHFFTSARMRKHMLVHTGEQPYLCRTCLRRFRDRSNMIKHSRRMHSIVVPLMEQLNDSFKKYLN